VTRLAVRRQLRLVQLDQIFHLSALAVDVLIEVLRRGGPTGSTSCVTASGYGSWSN
jgi:hypothetical protein